MSVYAESGLEHF